MVSMESEMTDILFDLEGDFLPEGYVFALWKEIVRILPRLEEWPHAGMLPLKGSASGQGLLLPRRAKLALRIPMDFSAEALELSGKTLDIGGCSIRTGKGGKRPIEAYPTLHAHFVESDREETDFLGDVAGKLDEMGITGKLICGRHQIMPCGNERLSGYSLVVHDLKPAGSIRLQHFGLGKYRHFGCGQFVPHKTISGLE